METTVLEQPLKKKKKKKNINSWFMFLYFRKYKEILILYCEDMVLCSVILKEGMLSLTKYHDGINLF